MGKGIVLGPITRPEGSKLIGVLSMVTAGPLMETNFPATEKPVGFAVKTCPATVKTDSSG